MTCHIVEGFNEGLAKKYGDPDRFSSKLGDLLRQATPPPRALVNLEGARAMFCVLKAAHNAGAYYTLPLVTKYTHEWCKQVAEQLGLDLDVVNATAEEVRMAYVEQTMTLSAVHRDTEVYQSLERLFCSVRRLAKDHKASSARAVGRGFFAVTYALDASTLYGMHCRRAELLSVGAQ